MIDKSSVRIFWEEQGKAKEEEERAEQHRQGNPSQQQGTECSLVQRRGQCGAMLISITWASSTAWRLLGPLLTSSCLRLCRMPRRSCVACGSTDRAQRCRSPAEQPTRLLLQRLRGSRLSVLPERGSSKLPLSSASLASPLLTCLNHGIILVGKDH